MSASVSSPSVASLQNDATRDVADRSAVLASPLLDQPFIIGPRFSPVPAKLVAQISAVAREGAEVGGGGGGVPPPVFYPKK